jgi:hypothetical protein
MADGAVDCGEFSANPGERRSVARTGMWRLENLLNRAASLRLKNNPEACAKQTLFRV